MKKIIIVASLMFGGVAFVNAQDQQKSTIPAQGQTTDDQERQEIAISELPAAITTSLESQDFSGWTVGSAYKKTDASNDNMEMYVIELKKGSEIKKVKFDKDGNKLDHEDKDKKEDQK